MLETNKRLNIKNNMLNAKITILAKIASARMLVTTTSSTTTHNTQQLYHFLTLSYLTRYRDTIWPWKMTSESLIIFPTLHSSNSPFLDGCQKRTKTTLQVRSRVYKIETGNFGWYEYLSLCSNTTMTSFIGSKSNPFHNIILHKGHNMLRSL